MTVGRLLKSVSLRYRHPACWNAGGVHRVTDWQTAGAKKNPKEEGERRVRPVRLARLEAILFLSREPLGSRKLAQLAGLADGTKARTLVRALNRRYDAEGGAFRAEEVAGGFQLLTRPKFAPWLRRLHSTTVEVRLSAPAMETLAIVAYRQPILRVEIEAIRGVQCGEILRQLIERDLVRIFGRSDELGRPLLYGTTRQFLQVFGLRHIEDLPRHDFLPMTNRVTEGAGNTVAGPLIENPSQLHNSSDMLEETQMRTTINKKVMLGEPEASGFLAASNDPSYFIDEAKKEDLDDEDDLDDDDDDEDEDDDDLDDEPWEEVDDEDEEDDEDDDWDDEDDWEEEEDVDDDDDWEDDDDDDWEEDDDEEEEAGDE